ncbi:DUF1758 domain-containing protein [Trichonephila clavipes]|nr:DUF1758 domain-containing protein [Trichonephila clavipes]
MDADKIKNKRKALKSSATKFVNNLNTILVNETNVHSLEIVYNQLIEKIDCLKIADNELLSVIDVKDIENEVEQCESFMENLISYKCKISQKIASLTPPIVPPTIVVNTTNLPSSTIETITHEPRSSIKLPKLTVNKFYGDHTKIVEKFKFKDQIIPAVAPPTPALRLSQICNVPFVLEADITLHSSRLRPTCVRGIQHNGHEERIAGPFRDIQCPIWTTLSSRTSILTLLGGVLLMKRYYSIM